VTVVLQLGRVEEELVGQLQVPEAMRNGVVFLYCRVGGELRPAGTAFFVAYPVTDDDSFTVLLTAHHVIAGIERVSDDNRTLIRLNTLSGGATWFETSTEFWRHDDPHVDCALLPWHPPTEMNVDFSAWHLRDGIATDEVIRHEALGVGDEVFMVGLFRRHLGQDRNEPIVRIGNVAALPADPIRGGVYGDMRAILIEARSIGGLSGSPVFIHMGYVRWRDGAVMHATGEMPFQLLGLMHGHWDVSESEIDNALDSANGRDSIHTGIGIVVPIEQIMQSVTPFLEQHAATWRLEHDHSSQASLDAGDPEPTGE